MAAAAQILEAASEPGSVVHVVALL